MNLLKPIELESTKSEPQYIQVKKSLMRSRLPDGIKNVKKQIYCITNVWNNLTEEGGKKGDDLCNSGSP